MMMPAAATATYILDFYYLLYSLCFFYPVMECGLRKTGFQIFEDLVIAYMLSRLDFRVLSRLLPISHISSNWFWPHISRNIFIHFVSILGIQSLYNERKEGWRLPWLLRNRFETIWYCQEWGLFHCLLWKFV